MKTIKIVNRLIARDLSILEKDVELVNNYFWKSFKNKLVDLEVPTIYVKEIGTFTVSNYKNNVFIIHLIKKLRNIDTLPYKDETKEEIRQATYKNLRKCLKFRNCLATQEYNEFIQRNNNTSS